MQVVVDLTVLDPEQGNFGIECRTCGPLVIINGTLDDAHHYCLAHLRGHGCAIPDITVTEEP